MRARCRVLFVNPPNTDDFKARKDNRVSRGAQHTDWANFPHLGILSLASYIDRRNGLEAVYLDGVACPWEKIVAEIEDHRHEILAICVSVITANYEAGLELCRIAKAIDPRIGTIMGNDHFTSEYHEIMQQRSEAVDYGIVGNEVYESLLTLLSELKDHGSVKGCAIPGLVCRSQGSVVVSPTKAEAIFSEIDYDLIDRTFDHSSIYSGNFKRRLGPRLQQLLGREVRKGVPIEIGRGCIKFQNNDACSFCSIQYGGVWKNSMPTGASAWSVVKQAVDHGYDYLYVTADELPLTFASLIRDMHDNQPNWWKETCETERPILTGYARADGLQKGRIIGQLYDIGFRILYIGVDGGSPLSLAAMNKPLRKGSFIDNANRMFASNLNAIERARESGMKLKAGLILGHLGMDQRLLDENVRSYKSLITSGLDVIVSVDVEIISPEPGSRDYLYLTKPTIATEVARGLGLDVSSPETQNRIAERYLKVDSFSREQAIMDYVESVMPQVSFATICQAREDLRSYCKSIGIVVGDDL